MDILHKGQVIQHSFTVPEGQTTEDVLDRLYQDDRFQGLSRLNLKKARYCPKPISTRAALLAVTLFYECSKAKNLRLPRSGLTGPKTFHLKPLMMPLSWRLSLKKKPDRMVNAVL